MDVTNMSTVEKLRSSDLDVDIKCTKCKALVRPPEYIDIYDVLHFVCDTCGYEWVE